MVILLPVKKCTKICLTQKSAQQEQTGSCSDSRRQFRRSRRHSLLATSERRLSPAAAAAQPTPSRTGYYHAGTSAAFVLVDGFEASSRQSGVIFLCDFRGQSGRFERTLEGLMVLCL